jgi:hypothetical protein
MYTNTAITIYNKRSDGYHRHVIDRVFWDSVKQSNINKSGISSSDSVSIFIPLEMLENYVEPKAYIALSSTGDKFTFQANSADLIIKGIVNNVIDNTSQQTQSTSLAAIRNAYDNVVAVTIVDDKRFGSPAMQHFQLSCK